MVPPDRPGTNSFIDTVEAKFPGTARWFRHPIWMGLQERTLTEREIIEALSTLKPAVARIVLTQKYPDGRPRSSPAIACNHEIAGALIRTGSFDALGAAVLLVRFSEIIAATDLRKLALSVYYGLQPKLAKLKQVAPVYPQLFSLIDFSCRQWVFINPALRMEIMVTWQGMRDTVWPRTDLAMKRNLRSKSKSKTAHPKRKESRRRK